MNSTCFHFLKITIFAFDLKIWRMVLEILLDALRNSVLISGLVVVMMMLIESMNIDSRGDFFKGMRRSRIGQIVISAFLGIIPGCMGGFASVSLYTHGIISFGALVAMTIATSGDESFVLLATVPDKALWIFLILFAVSIAVGLIVDYIYKPKRDAGICQQQYSLHEEDTDTERKDRHISWKRIAMFVGVTLFIAALLSGHLEHEHGEDVAAGHIHGGINLLSEEWMNWLFGGFSLILLGVLIWGSDHFIEEHLWHHIVLKHLPSVFLWTFGILVLINAGLEYLDLERWISDNTLWMIAFAALVGIIPESGPHLIFVTLYASGLAPLSVLLASSISQDGHACLPLIAESKKSFLWVKIINCTVALLAGFVTMWLS